MTVQTLFKDLQWCLQHTTSLQTEKGSGVTVLGFPSGQKQNCSVGAYSMSGGDPRLDR